MNLLNAQWLTCNWSTTLKTYFPGKKALNPHCFLFWLTLKLNVRHDRPLRKKKPFKSLFFLWIDFVFRDKFCWLFFVKQTFLRRIYILNGNTGNLPHGNYRIP